MREPLGLAYLLARAADTVADTRLVPRAERLQHLETLRRAVAGGDADVTRVVAACVPGQADRAERELLARTAEAVDHVARLPPADAAQVRRVLDTITRGQVFDLERFPGEDASGLAALATWADLDHYTYLVAGCVGEFWTTLHVAHRPALAGWDLPAMRRDGVRLGKALQMTNVLRDVARDLRFGRCYLPADELAVLGLAPPDLLDPSRSPRVRPLFESLLAITGEHYDAGWRYTLAIPRREWRMRLACAWPLLIGVATLAAFRALPDPLAAPRPVKLSRRQVRAILLRSALRVGSNRALAGEASRLGGGPRR